MALEEGNQLHVHNLRMINRKHGGVVSESERKENKMVFKKRRLRDYFFPFHMATINLFIEFIYIHIIIFIIFFFQGNVQLFCSCVE